MLAPERRLTSAAEFRAVSRRGHRAAAAHLVVHVLVADGHLTHGQLGPARAGFVVSKAVGDAVTRNLVKRRLRHLVRERLPGLGAGSQVVVRALPSAAGAGYAELGADLDRALARALARAQRRTAGASA